MSQLLRYTLALVMLTSIRTVNAQAPFSWKFVLDGYNDVWLADLAVDSLGNTYAGVNYMDHLTVPVLNKKLPWAGHVHGLILKLDKNGKPLWAHAFQSNFDNRINDVSLAPNGDLLVTGFGDGQMRFPGLHDTLKLGKPAENVNFYITRYQGLYVARYRADGERKWAQYFDCGWGEGTSVAANKKNEVWLSMYYQGNLKQGSRMLDSIPRNSKIEYRAALAKLDEEGKFQSMFIMNEGPGGTPGITAHVKFDKEDNALLYGTFYRNIHLTPTDSLYSDGPYDGTDSYIARFNNKGKLVWCKRIGGQSSQSINDLDIADDNSVYATGNYMYECAVSDGISLPQKSAYKYKSGYSFFYLHLMNDGELDFARYEESEGYNSYLLGYGIALDDNGYSHIVGYFTDTLNIDGNRVTTTNSYTGFYSFWDGKKLQQIGKAGMAPKGHIFTWKIDINHNQMASGGDYYGDGACLMTKNRSEELPNKDYGRVAYLFGGKVNTTKKHALPAKTIDPRETRLQLIKTFDACTTPSLPDFWLQVDTTQSQTIKTPCGQEIKGMEVTLYPNPTQGEVKIKLSGITGKTQVEVFSLKGELLLSHYIDDAIEGQIISLNLQGLANATYIVRITHKNFQKGLKVVKIG